MRNVLSKLKLHPLYFYLGSVLLAQLIFFRAVSIELGLDQLGVFAQMLAIAFVTAAITRFGCENAIGRVILAAEAPIESHRTIGFQYIMAALLRSLPFIVPLYLLGSIFIEFGLVLTALSILFAFNLSYSFLERALGNHFVMVLLDSRASLTLLASLYYLLDYMPSSGLEIMNVLALIEAGKFVLYTSLMARHFTGLDLRGAFAGFRFRTGFAVNELLSIVSNYGFQIFLPMLIGATGAGVFFMLQRLANPLTFILNVSNSMTTARIIRQRDAVRRIYMSSVKELAVVSVVLGVAALMLRTPLLEFFDVRTYSFEFTLILGGVIMNLLTGASAPVFNNMGRPIFNSLASLCFIVSFVALTGLIWAISSIDLRAIAWIFLISSACKNFVVLFGLKRLSAAGQI